MAITQNTAITLTPQAAEQLKTLLSKEESESLALRVYVAGGGCSGLQYGMALDDDFSPADQLIESDGVKVVVDEMSMQYLVGSEIDYVDSLMGAGFTVHNPNAVSSCSCGQSFDTGDSAGSARACGCGGH